MKITDNDSIQGAKASGIQPFHTAGQDGDGMAEMAEKPSLDVESNQYDSATCVN